MQLNDAQLFKQHAFINGTWHCAATNKTLNVINPATEENLGSVPQMDNNDIHRAVDAAKHVLPQWRSMTAQQRATLLYTWHELMLENRSDLARILTLEQGKPLKEAEGEIVYAASFIRWFAEQATRTNGMIIPSPTNDKRMLAIKQPVGVCAAITPWNFPSVMITRKVAPALAAGCTMVLKPASQTPFSALALAELANRAGIPAGVFNIVTGKASVIGDVLTTHPDVRKLTFTGSTEIGRQLMKKSSETVKKISLELGGNAPFIVFDDADIDAAVDGAIATKFRNAGQTCICVNRFYIHQAIYDVFAQKFTLRVKQLSVGNGLDEGVMIGPLINHDAVEKVNELTQDAINCGAEVLIGNTPHPLGGNYITPTVLSNVPNNARLLNEEIFGPMAALIPFEDEKQVIEHANDTIFGLAAYFYSQNPRRIWQVSEALEYGMVGVNTGEISNEVTPFGGVKQSGLGREGSELGIDEFMEVKYICQGRLV